MSTDQNNLETIETLLKTAEQGTEFRVRCAAIVREIVDSVRDRYPDDAGLSDMSDFDKGRWEVAQQMLSALSGTSGTSNA